MSSNPEDIKLHTLAKATMSRSNSTSAAALRDSTGRTYVAIPVKSGAFEIEALLAVLTVAKASQINGIEAVVIVGDLPSKSALEIIKNESSSVLLFHASDVDSLISL